MNDDNSTTQDPAAIEREIRRTQDDMSRTVDKIGDQLTPRNIFNSLLDKADANNVDARMLFDGARRNPVALGLIAAGTIWLISDKDSKIPSMPKFGSKDGDTKGFNTQDASHRDYVSHMSAIEMRDGEEVSAYQRRRDQHRANFMMVEQKHDEDDHGFRDRLDSITDKFRDKRQAWSDSSVQAGNATKQKARMAADKTQDFYNSNPLVGGFLAIAAGAALGSGLPITRQEQDKLGAVGSKARDLVSEQTDQLSSKFQEKKDELVEQADQKLQQSGSDQQQGQGQQGQQQPEGQQPQGQQQQFAGSDQATQQPSPFSGS